MIPKISSIYGLNLEGRIFDNILYEVDGSDYNIQDYSFPVVLYALKLGLRHYASCIECL
jgi:hypothetical protein